MSICMRDRSCMCLHAFKHDTSVVSNYGMRDDVVISAIEK